MMQCGFNKGLPLWSATGNIESFSAVTMSEHAIDFWLLAEGAVTALAIVGAGILATAGIRRQNHTRAKADASELPFPLPDFTFKNVVAVTRPTDIALHELIQTEHNHAKTFQDRTVAYLVGASLTLLGAFAGSVASVTILQTSEAFHLFAAAVDITALVLVVWAFRQSGISRAMWIRQRVLTEFLRHWAATDYLLLSNSLAFSARYDAYFASVKAAVSNLDEDQLKVVADFGSSKLERLREAICDEADLSPISLRRFIERRPIRQTRWFATALHRVAILHSRRRKLMLGLFGAAVTSSVVKLVASLLQDGQIVSWATFALLTIIGVAAASTSTYLGQNVRSLHHRYNSQLRTFQSWFTNYSVIFELASKTEMFTQTELNLVADAIVSFETIMLSELTDWIAISTNDTMEIAPS